METQRHLFPEFTSGSTKGQGEECGVSVRKLSSVPLHPGANLPPCLPLSRLRRSPSPSCQGSSPQKCPVGLPHRP